MTKAPDFHHQLLVVSGGNAGLSVAAQLPLADPALDVAILEPATKHYCQPAWTLVGGGAYDIKDTERAEGDYRIKDAAATFEPEANTVVTASGQRLTYDYLMVCPGI
ncbi:hypothetical protein QMK33_20870 [Hymenobacter sp. H14-R3]|uniref:hypothetical protein n=1 Tax=Hymenobacter sp. H14-R3 TaxID=3046308 RepID=UPI0024BA7FCB|nr:hypothetical protein [Hymenobacter sp. H14-R3]MDJ0367607.1 hypothetical protein [Hymenobacter sp. H14-R3]